jgi:hypothetical protein
MAVRLVVTFHAAPGKGTELAQAMKARWSRGTRVASNRARLSTQAEASTGLNSS